MKESHAYDDILHLARPVSEKHPPMPRADRAAQFSPFAALTGHEAAIRETARLTDRRVELDEEEKVRLGEKLQLLADCAAERPPVTLTCFRPDPRKAGGKYDTVSGHVKRIDAFAALVFLEDGRKIRMEHICAIESPLLPREDE